MAVSLKENNFLFKVRLSVHSCELKAFTTLQSRKTTKAPCQTGLKALRAVSLQGKQLKSKFLTNQPCKLAFLCDWVEHIWSFFNLQSSRSRLTCHDCFLFNAHMCTHLAWPEPDGHECTYIVHDCEASSDLLWWFAFQDELKLDGCAELEKNCDKF
jgi:hypothetical protein